MGGKEVHIGQVVKELNGRNQNRYAVIVGIVDSRFVRIADGDKRKFDQAKKKNIQHLQPESFIGSEVADSIAESGRVTNGKLRFVLNKFIDQLQREAQQKGE